MWTPWFLWGELCYGELNFSKHTESETKKERERGKQRDRCGGFLLLIWMCVQPAALGSGLSFNTNAVSTTQPVTVRLHYICWGWGALITLHCCSRCFFLSLIHMLLSVLSLLSLFHDLSEFVSQTFSILIRSDGSETKLGWRQLFTGYFSFFLCNGIKWRCVIDPFNKHSRSFSI